MPLRNHRVVILGAGTAGIGIADQVRGAMMREGLSAKEAAGRFWLVDRQGLLTTDMSGQLGEYQAAYARPSAESTGWKHDETSKGVDLAEVMHRVKPTVLIGASASPGSFTEPVIREMALHTERPIIFVLSTPINSAEATPSDLIAWTNGRGLIATGSSFAPFTYKGVTYAVAQINNAMLCPGLCLGAIVSRATQITDDMFAAAASAVSSLVTVRQPGASLLPHMDNLRNVATTVAVAVAEVANEQGLARVKLKDIAQSVLDTMWQPEYRPVQAAPMELGPVPQLIPQEDN